MDRNEPILVGRNGADCLLLPQMANRHGLIAGATGTGKTVTLQVLAENFSARGVPVFMADVKGDLSGISQPGGQSPKVRERANQLKLQGFTASGCPVVFWDIFGEQGHPIRGTVSEMGPLLLGRLLQLNDVQAGVLNLIFKIADDHGLLLLDLKDLRAMCQYVGENAGSFRVQYGNISAASIGSIQRGLIELDTQGAVNFFSEPALNFDDLLQTASDGRGVVNILCGDKLIQRPRLYGTVLLWMLSELYERLPEVGDLPTPKLVFFFDEAHLLFNDAPSALLEKIEQVVRLVRSKGVGIYFVTQNPRDVPDNVLGQLGNRVQHALRAFTPRDQKAVQSAAETFRANPKFDTAKVLMELGVGEALISCLDEKGQPAVVQRAWVLPPQSQIGPITPDMRRSLITQSIVAGVYDQAVDRESAYEKLAAAANGSTTTPPVMKEPNLPRPVPQPPLPRGRQSDSVFTAMTKSVVRSIGSTVGRELVRGLFGSLLGTRRRR